MKRWTQIGALLATVMLASSAGPATADAGRILFSSENELWSVSPHGGKPKRLTRDGTPTRPYVGPSASRAGDRVAFRRGNQIYVADRALRRRQRQPLLRGFTNVTAPTLSADGRHLKWGHSESMSDVSSCEALVGRRPRCPVKTPVWEWLTGGRRVISGPDWLLCITRRRSCDRVVAVPAPGATFLDVSVSPDERMLAVSETGASTDRIVLFAMATGRRVRDLTSDYLDSAPVWSPDGRHLAFYRDVRPTYDQPYTDRGLWLVSREGGPPTRLVTDRLVSDPTWSR